jgi:hypothetical protein
MGLRLPSAKTFPAPEALGKGDGGGLERFPAYILWWGDSAWDAGGNGSPAAVGTLTEEVLHG